MYVSSSTKKFFRAGLSLLAVGGILSVNLFAAGSANLARTALPNGPLPGRALSLPGAIDGLLNPTADETKPYNPGTAAEVLYPEMFGVLPSLKDAKPHAFQTRFDRAENEMAVLPKVFVGSQKVQPDGALQEEPGTLEVMGPPIANFDGLSTPDNGNTIHPPDTNGDIGYDPASGKKFYFQWVNIVYKVWDVTNPAAPIVVIPTTAGNALWANALPGTRCALDNDGDPIALFDEQAGRWMISQFALNGANGPFHQCIAVSQTADPTGAWYVYDYAYSTTLLNDYPHFGVWPDPTYNAYYMTVHDFLAPSFAWRGQAVVAFDRAKMLVGNPTAAMVRFSLFNVNQNFGGMLPADLDGAPPAPGTPGFFFEVDDDTAGMGPDAMRVWEFKPNWTTPASSTFGVNLQPNYTMTVASFNLLPCTTGGSRSCIPQPGTTVGLDAIGDRLMYRVAFRQHGGIQSAVMNHTVWADGTNRAGVRWYEARRDAGSGAWSVHQQGTFAPADGIYRWMGSIAMDYVGNIALGYSASSGTVTPSVRYAGRAPADPLGTLPETEQIMTPGVGSQTSGANRWGDYSMMGVDPQDQCTFWYTQEYHGPTAAVNWRTRIGSFKFDSCSLGPVGYITGTVRNAVTTAPIAGAQVQATSSPTQTFGAISNASGVYTITAPAGTYNVTASATNYYSTAVSGVTVAISATTLQNFNLNPYPVLTGQVTNAAFGTPVPGATVTLAGPQPGSTTTNAGGYYTFTVPAGTYTVTASATYYSPASAVVVLSTGTTTQNLALTPIPALMYNSNLVSGGDGDNYLEPNETANLHIGIRNDGFVTATAVNGTLVSDIPNATILSANSAYPNIASAAVQTNTTAYQVHLDAGYQCGAPLTLTLNLTSAQGPFVAQVPVRTGPPPGGTVYNSTNVPMVIPDNPTVTSTLGISDTGTIVDLNVTLNITHTWDEDLDIYLVSPTGTRVELTTDNGGSGDNYITTVFDDEAATAITAGTAPFNGTYRPEGSLAALDGQSITGVWKLEIDDDVNADTGTLNAWSLSIDTGTVGCNVPTPRLARDGQSYNDSLGNNDGYIYPGENNLRASVSLTNTGTSVATNVTATFTALSPNVTVVTPTASYGNLAAGAGAANATPFGFNVGSNAACGSDLNFGVTAYSAEGIFNNLGTFSFPVGQRLAYTHTNTTPVTIVDEGTITSIINVASAPRAIADVEVLINLNHTWDSDLAIFLISPSGTRVELTSANGGSGDNYIDTIFDDEAATAITAGVAPFTGRYRPETPLTAAEAGMYPGDWTLEINDTAAADVGTLNNWELRFVVAKCADVAYMGLNKTVSAATIQPTQLLTYTLTGQNTGDLALTSAVFTDALPANTTFVSASDGGTFSGGVVTWNLGTVALNAYITRTLVVQVNAGTPDATIINNQFRLSSAQLPAGLPSPMTTTEVDAFAVLAAVPAGVSQSQGANTVTTRTIYITNTGTAPLIYSIEETTSTVNGAAVVLSVENTETPTTPATRSKDDVVRLSHAGVAGSIMSNPAAPHQGGLSWIVDDGSMEDSIGLTSGGQFVWLNRFTPNAADFPFFLDEVQFIFNTTTGVGDNIQIVVWQDTDGDGDPGTGATFLYTQDVTVQANDGSTWNVYALNTPVLLADPGDLLVGAVNRSGASGYSDFPAAIDQGASQQRSWVGIYGAGDPPAQPPLPADSSWGTIDSFGLAGNWMLRGYGRPAYDVVDVPWISETPVSGTVNYGGAAQAVTLAFDSTGLAMGTYTATLVLHTNAPNAPIAYVPVTLTVTSVPVYGVNATVNTTAQSARPGQMVTYTYRITNTGNITDTYDMGVSNVPAFTATVSSPVGPLGPGQSAIAYVTVQIPANAADGASSTANIFVSSQGGNASATSSLTTTSVWYRNYGPLIRK